MSRFFGAVVLSAALFVPATVLAQDHQDRQDTQNKRYYDSAHKDYHQWNSNEDQSWHQYLQENHKSDHDFSKANKREQTQYWNWRHEHPDSH